MTRRLEPAGLSQEEEWLFTTGNHLINWGYPFDFVRNIPRFLYNSAADNWVIETTWGLASLSLSVSASPLSTVINPQHEGEVTLSSRADTEVRIVPIKRSIFNEKLSVFLFILTDIIVVLRIMTVSLSSKSHNNHNKIMEEALANIEALLGHPGRRD